MPPPTLCPTPPHPHNLSGTFWWPRYGAPCARPCIIGNSDHSLCITAFWGLIFKLMFTKWMHNLQLLREYLPIRKKSAASKNISSIALHSSFIILKILVSALLYYYNVVIINCITCIFSIQQAHDVKIKSPWRRIDVITAHRRHYDIILTSCARLVVEAVLFLPLL